MVCDAEVFGLRPARYQRVIGRLGLAPLAQVAAWLARNDQVTEAEAFETLLDAIEWGELVAVFLNPNIAATPPGRLFLRAGKRGVAWWRQHDRAHLAALWLPRQATAAWLTERGVALPSWLAPPAVAPSKARSPSKSDPARTTDQRHERIKRAIEKICPGGSRQMAWTKLCKRVRAELGESQDASGYSDKTITEIARGRR